MDIFVEQIVTKKPSSTDTAKKVGISAGILIVCAFFILFLMGYFPLNILLCFLALYGGYYLFTGIDCEYEYIVTNGDLDIDKIIAKRKRKRLISVKVSTFDDFGVLSADTQTPKDITTVLAGKNTGEGDYYADFNHPTLGNVRLIFTPEEKITEGLKPYLPRLIKAKFH